ncbi:MULTISPECIES: hypothetical protein [Succinivibrio]|uniref:Uncharacterized protein n=1 Tax=Succinivibrio faecicola TaxID=2820300 RepID=A0ABS7DJ08_9GAMM|nr:MULTISPECIES: hypothetical protein [Succinivibrio]MBQ2382336.1 hypothetical protein [Succinivibrio sp.]MBW7571067.1 hypothetical protein [Succinivibrio faecicola]MCI6939424.1 hypothetical protein [Succinatimonas hippei]MDD6205313.1 hypothetical protein [Succinivibrio sp.]
MQSKLEPLKALLNSISSNTSVKEDELLHNLIVLRNTKKVDQKLSSFNGVEVKDLMNKSSYDLKKNYVKNLLEPAFSDKLRSVKKKEKIKKTALNK